MPLSRFASANALVLGVAIALAQPAAPVRAQTATAPAQPATAVASSPLPVLPSATPAPTISAAAYVLVEAAGNEEVIEPLSEVVAAIADLVRDVAVATDAPRRAALWHYREAHTEAINRVGTPHKLDVALPATELAAFVDEVPRRLHVGNPSARVWLFGHAADGNVHVNVTGVDPDDAEPFALERPGLTSGLSL